MPYNMPCKYLIKQNRNMIINGKGRVSTIPDMADITFGVITVNENLSIAQKENAVITNNVFIAIKELGIKDEDIKTKSYTINKKYNIENGKKIFSGYEVTNKFTITVRDIELIGKVIDTAVNNGANYANEIKFEVSNPSLYNRKALTLAIENAVIKSQDIGRTLGIKVKEIPYKIIEQKYNTMFRAYEPTLRVPEATTPISAGEMEFVSTIKAAFFY